MIVSVVVPMYNAAAYVGAALDSILGQSRAPDEIIVVDDGSSDGSREVIAAYGAAVRLLRQQHKGPAAALNRGLRAAAGSIVAFLDADDLWLPEKLAIQLPVLAGDPAVDGVFGYLEQFLSEDAASAAGRFAVASEPMAGVNRTTLVMRRDALERFGWYDETLATADFVPWWARATALGFNHRTVDAVVARRRIHLTNTGTLRRREQQQESLLGLRDALALRRRMKDGPR